MWKQGEIGSQCFVRQGRSNVRGYEGGQQSSTLFPNQSWARHFLERSAQLTPLN